MSVLPDFRPGELSAIGLDVQDGRVICGFEVGAIAMTQELFDRAVAESGRLCRPLSQEDLQRLVRAEGGQNANH